MGGRVRIDELAPDASVGDFAPFHINVEELDDLIETYGVSGYLRRAIPCPCARIETGRASATCTVCKGVGWAYPDGDRCEIMMLATGRQGRMQWAQAGLMTPGTVSITFPSGLIPGAGDMVLPDGDKHVVTEQLWSQEQQIDTRAARSRVIDRTTWVEPGRPRKDRLLYPGTCELQRCYWVGDDGELVAGVAGSDFALVERTQGTEIEWLSDRAPKPGQCVSVRYLAPAAYIVVDSQPVVRTTSDRVLPYRALMSRLDKHQRSDLR